MYIIGVLELAGAIALVIPILSGLAGVAFMGLMVGAVVTTVVAFDGQNITTPIFMFVVVALIAWARRRTIADLLTLLRPRRSVA